MPTRAKDGKIAIQAERLSEGTQMLSEAQRVYERARHQRRKAADPDFRRKQSERSRRSYERRKDDPVFMEKLRRYEAVYLAKKRDEDPDFRHRDSRRNCAVHARRKFVALSHYSKTENPSCCWPGCTVDDLDMLTLDHIANDGYKRKGCSGSTLYAWVIAHKFPEGLQTLCWNHQWKKRHLHLRCNSLSTQETNCVRAAEMTVPGV